MKHIVGFSGGVDSQATALWVRERYPAEDIIFMNSDAGGNEDPLTTAWIDDYSRTVFPVVMVNAVISDIWETPGFAETKGLNGADPLTFDRMIMIKGRPPSRKAQFCTEILKLRPHRRWIKQNVIDDYERYVGLRRDESEARRNTPERQWDDYFDCYVNFPLRDWTKQQCFDYVLSHGEEVNPLYRLGFNRVGCAPCINSSKQDVLNWLLRRPAMIDKIRGWEERTGKNYFAPSCVPGLPYNNIDQVIAWAHTSHGGRQALLPIMHERSACESKYGLCE